MAGRLQEQYDAAWNPGAVQQRQALDQAFASITRSANAPASYVNAASASAMR